MHHCYRVPRVSVSQFAAVVVLLIAVLAVSFPSWAATWVVPSDAPTIAAGIDSAAVGDTVLVSCQVYYEQDIYVKSGIVLTSETGSPDCVTIDGLGMGRIFRRENITGDTEIVGFRMVDGYAPDGGGIMYCLYADYLSVSNCIFEYGDSMDGAGGAVYIDSGNPSFIDCEFRSNTSVGSGGAIHCFSSSPTFTGCSFVENSGGTGGALSLHSWSSPQIAGCVFWNNSAGRGGAIYCHGGSNPVVTSTTLVGNAGFDGGGGFSCDASSNPSLDRCITAFGSAGEAVECDGSSSVGLTCCDVYGNAGGDWVGCIAGQADVGGNMSEDPLFCEIDEVDFRVGCCSPCVDAGGCGTVGAFGIGCGGGAFLVPTDYPTIQEAIDNAAPCDTVFVLPGTHYEHDISLESGIVVAGSTGDASDVVVDGSGESHVFVCSGVSSTAVVRDITITNGSTSGGSGGGGMLIEDSDVRVENCTFHDNSALPGGGGIAVVGSSSPLITGCRFHGNTSGYSGGGARVSGSEAAPSFEDCTFSADNADTGGAVYALDSSAPTFTGCTFRDQVNCSAVQLQSAAAEFEECVFYHNHAATSGGAVLADTSSVTMMSCTLEANSAPSGSGLRLRNGSTAELDHTIISDGVTGAAVVCGPGCVVTASCCDIYGNDGGDYVGCLAGQEGVSGNFSEDPLYCWPGRGGLTLHATSPCLDDPGCGQVGALGLGCSGRTWVVPDDAPTVAAGIESAAVYDTVLITAGTYCEHGVELKPRILLTGPPEGGGEATVDAQGLGQVFVCLNLGSETTIRNLTITHGDTAGVADGGGGMYCHHSDHHVEGCSFVSNACSFGGAVRVEGGSPVFSDCEFVDNEAYNSGGAASVWSGSPVFGSCDFVSNTATNAGVGGALSCYSGSVVNLDDCEMYRNTCTADGGGIYGHSSSIDVSWSVLGGNAASGNGGAVSAYACTLSIVNSTLGGNSAGTGSGLMISGATDASVDHTTIADGVTGEAVYCSGASIDLTCSDVYGNDGGDYVGCLAGQGGVGGNFSSDPMFCDPASDDYRVSAASPCLDAAGCGQVGALGSGCGRTWHVLGDAPTIAAGIDSGAYGDVVVVACGVYYEHGIDMKPGVVLTSETGEYDCVTIDASSFDDKVFDCSGPDAGSVIRGFTLRAVEEAEIAGLGISVQNASFRVENCWFVSMHSAVDGGGVRLRQCDGVVFENCVFDSCRAAEGGAAWRLGGSASFEGWGFYYCESANSGGALAVDGDVDATSVSVTNCTFYGNHAAGLWGGGGSAVSAASDMKSRAPANVEMYNTIVAFGLGGGAAFCEGTGTVTLSCCDVYGNAGGDYVDCIAGQEYVNGNLSQDPLFCGEDNPDAPYTLQGGSPCSQENSPLCGQIGAFGVGCASVVEWTGLGDGCSWDDPNNWNPTRVPGPNDHAKILPDGTYTVNVDSTQVVWALTHGGGTGTQILDVLSDTLAVTHGATNRSVIRVRDQAVFQAQVGADSSVVSNEAGATFVLEDGDLAGRGVFRNAGDFQKSGSGWSHLALSFVNQGESSGGGFVEVLAGTLAIDGEFDSTGRVNVNSGATAIVSSHFLGGGRAPVRLPTPSRARSMSTVRSRSTGISKTLAGST